MARFPPGSVADDQPMGRIAPPATGAIRSSPGRKRDVAQPQNSLLRHISRRKPARTNPDGQLARRVHISLTAGCVPRRNAHENGQWIDFGGLVEPHERRPAVLHGSHRDFPVDRVVRLRTRTVERFAVRELSNQRGRKRHGGSGDEWPGFVRSWSGHGGGRCADVDRRLTRDVLVGSTGSLICIK